LASSPAERTKCLEGTVPVDAGPVAAAAAVEASVEVGRQAAEGSVAVKGNGPAGSPADDAVPTRSRSVVRSPLHKPLFVLIQEKLKHTNKSSVHIFDTRYLYNEPK